MNFNLTEDQLAFQQAAKEFAIKEMAPHAAKWDKESIFPVDVIKATGELGFLGLYSPEEYGGLGLSRLDSSIIFEEMSQHCTSTTAFLTIHNMCAWMVLVKFMRPKVLEPCRPLLAKLLLTWSP